MTVTDPAQLRRTVVRATVSLLGEYETLTTERIARAAGVGEAELLAVFADKEAVLAACATALTESLTAVLDPAGEVRRMAAIPPDQPLASRLVQVIDILGAYHRRVRAGMDGLLPAGENWPPAESGALPAFAGSAELREAVAALLEPQEQRLRLPARVLAEGFVSLAAAAAGFVDPVPAERVVEVFLHGALPAAPG